MGIPVYYYRCDACNFIFTTYFDEYTHRDFAERIYNEEYDTIDPDHLERRPKSNAALIKNTFSAFKDDLKILDYGGATGVLGRELEAAGFKNIETYDPFLQKGSTKPTGKFNLVLCFEVVEHAVDPYYVFSDLIYSLADEGLIIFSTLVQPENIDEMKTNWWYICPRNAHISIYTQLSLQIVFERVGASYMTANRDLHCAFRQIPDFAKHLIR
jgi:2-polyprenyl-6-hydroxyphenyl methylase/3-demethylubiquinone-9 3-methyltransferase